MQKLLIVVHSCLLGGRVSITFSFNFAIVRGDRIVCKGIRTLKNGWTSLEVKLHAYYHKIMNSLIGQKSCESF